MSSDIFELLPRRVWDAFHKQFDELRVKGEWFRFEGALRDFLQGTE